MKNLEVDLKNCWGISALHYRFDFPESNNGKKAFAIYAPNGMMKTSFLKTFATLSEGKLPQEERYDREASCSVKIDGTPISAEAIYTLPDDKDTTDNTAITNILVNSEFKKRYDELVIDIEKKKSSMISALQKSSKVKKDGIESRILKDCNVNNLPLYIRQIINESPQEDLSKFEYAKIFNENVKAILENQDFLVKAREFVDRYNELFEASGTIYQKGVFNPTKADETYKVLEKQNYFKAGHKVLLQGDNSSLDQDEFKKRLKEVNDRLDADEKLKQIRSSLAKNTETKALNDLIESLSSSETEYFLRRIKPAEQHKFKKDLWAYYIQNCKQAQEFINAYDENEEEIREVERKAAEIAPDWLKIVNLFNDRFVDMPFSLSVSNHRDAVLGKEKAMLSFTFREDDNITKTYGDLKQAMKTLSRGESRALKLLYFIFDVEERKKNNKETFIIIDDIADSFDYKNKHAIIQYLRDLCNEDLFYQIILTHNFDFFRAISQPPGFVHRKQCLMANRKNNSIELIEAEGIKNIFINVWKKKVTKCNTILYASVPFTRNILEYTKGKRDLDYLKLTSLLHWKEETSSITKGNYLAVYKNLFGGEFQVSNTTLMIDILFSQTTEICSQSNHDGLNLENKVLLSIAIRIRAEQFIIERKRLIDRNPSYWYRGNNQFSNLMKEAESLNLSLSETTALEKVCITVSSNIHLNSFMYEPILDLSIEHLISLFKQIDDLCSPRILES